MAEDVTNPPATFFVVEAHVARERGDHDGAREAFDGALARGLLELPRGPTWTVTLTWAADICAWLEDRSTATSLCELLAPFANVMTWQYGPVGRGVALLDLALGRRASGGSPSARGDSGVRAHGRSGLSRDGAPRPRHTAPSLARGSPASRPGTRVRGADGHPRPAPQRCLTGLLVEVRWSGHALHELDTTPFGSVIWK